VKQQGVIHGIDRVLQPTSAATSLEKGTPQSGNRHLLQQLLQSVLVHPQHTAFGSRKLLQSGSQFGDWSSNNPASRLLATNTVQAAYNAETQVRVWLMVGLAERYESGCKHFSNAVLCCAVLCCAMLLQYQNAYSALPDSPGWSPM
jgi:hypothetical protein